MKIYTIGFRRIREIIRHNLAPVHTVVSAGSGDTGGLAQGLYYYVVSIKDTDANTVSAPAARFIIIR